MRKKKSWMSSAVIREAFVDYFQGRGHQLCAPSPLVSEGDSSLLFTNAGMNQFKACFLGQEQPPAPCVVTAQPCLRAGGKHNDLEEVGQTRRHHTYFEMLGNFSFGLLSPPKAIQLAWEFLTHPDALGLSPERLWVTFYESDVETAEIWKEVASLRKDQLVAVGDLPNQPFQSDNFWRMGDSGPCGPCTEIFFDLGPALEGTPPGRHHKGDRFMEVWNLVLMKHFQEAGGPLHPLPTVAIDTGLGLDRLACVLQGQQDNYQTEDFRKLITQLGRAFHAPGLPEQWVNQLPYRILSDHLRAIFALLNEKIFPSNQGPGYVLRRLIRRSWLQCLRLELQDSALEQALPFLFPLLQEQLPQLKSSLESCLEPLRQEREAFQQTLKEGQQLCLSLAKKAQGDVLTGEAAFLLYDTHGFPLDFILDRARSLGKSVDLHGFEKALEAQRQRSQQARFKAEQPPSARELQKFSLPMKEFEPALEVQMLQIWKVDGERCSQPIGPENYAKVRMSPSPFAPESGGVASDWGELVQLDPAGVTEARALVLKVEKKGVDEAPLHHLWVEQGFLSEGSLWRPRWNPEAREEKARHHTATHLLQYALREVLGKSVQQAGSSVHADRLRFDFRWPRPLSPRELAQVEGRLNQLIRENHPVLCETLSLAQAREGGALAFFEGRYQEQVQVYTLGPSKEVCGGPHAESTGQCGLALIVREESVSEGVRRIEACVSQAAFKAALEMKSQIQCACSQLKVAPEQIVEAVERSLTSARKLSQNCQKLNQILSKHWEEAWMEAAETTPRGGRCCWLRLEGKDTPLETLQVTLKKLQNESDGCVLWISPSPDEPHRLWFWVARPYPPFSPRELAEKLKGQREDLKGGGGSLHCQLLSCNRESIEAAWTACKAAIRKAAEFGDA